MHVAGARPRLSLRCLRGRTYDGTVRLSYKMDYVRCRSLHSCC